MTGKSDAESHEDRRDYEVGYGRPPKATRFRPGQSGNPKGRKRKPKSVQDQMDGILRKRIAVSEGGTTKRLTMQEVMLRTIANKAAKGDLKAASFVLNLLNSPDAAQAETLNKQELSSEDQLLFDEMMRELTGRSETAPTTQQVMGPSMEASSAPLSEQLHGEGSADGT